MIYLKKIHPIELFLWTVRRNEKDIINMYDSLSGIMRLATGGNMLNFGLWDDDHTSPLLAQENMCQVFAQISQLEPNQRIIDVGSGFASPAALWQSKYSPIEITCVDINFEQLHEKPADGAKINYVNATARELPFAEGSADRVLALESSHHFKPLKKFLFESFRVLSRNGMLVLAIPVVMRPVSFLKLGVLAMTWSSEHYDVDFVKSAIKECGFKVVLQKNIGPSVYEPLADYYAKNRESLKPKILAKYPSYVEKVLFNSLNKMKRVSKNGTIDYLLLSCKK